MSTPKQGLITNAVLKIKISTSVTSIRELEAIEEAWRSQSQLPKGMGEPGMTSVHLLSRIRFLQRKSKFSKNGTTISKECAKFISKRTLSPSTRTIPSQLLTSDPKIMWAMLWTLTRAHPSLKTTPSRSTKCKNPKKSECNTEDHNYCLGRTRTQQIWGRRLCIRLSKLWRVCRRTLPWWWSRTPWRLPRII